MLIGTLSVRETLQYTAMLRLDSNMAHRFKVGAGTLRGSLPRVLQD